MSQWNMIVDVSLCENCNNCMLATKDEYVGNAFAGYSAPQPLHGDSVIDITRHVRGSGHMVDVTYVPRMCNHCDNAPCIKAAPDAITKRADGIVIIDPVKAKGRRDIVKSCPYGAIIWNEEENLPQNWIFDAHLLDQGKSEPRCAHSCPTNVFKAVKASDTEMARRASDEKLQVLRPELGTKPRLYYKNLDRVTSHFIGGTVVARSGARTDVVEGASVTISIDGKAIATTHTDGFGDFKIDGLSATSGTYALQIAQQGFASASASAPAGESTFLGEVTLSK